MRLIFALAVLAGQTMVTAASADTHLPIYDIDRSCAGWTSEGNADMADLCVEMEQNLYDGLKVVWGDTPEYAKAYCLAQETAPTRDGRGAITMPHLRYEALSKCLSQDGRSRIPMPATERFKP